MKTKWVFLFFALWLCCSLAAAAENWQEHKSEHFVVFFSAGQEDFAAEVSDKAEAYYNSIASDLGYVRYANFWKWDKRAKIFIFPEHRVYINATGEPQWSHGVADYHRKTITSYAWGDKFLSMLLPHEIGHLIFRDFVGFKGEVPLWLDEGVAQWEEQDWKSQRKKSVRELAQNNLLLTLDFMMRTDIRGLKDEDVLRVQTLSFGENAVPEEKEMPGKTLIRVYYLQAFSLVGFMIEHYSTENFLVFCRQLRDGKTISEALRFAYPQRVRSIAELEQIWKQAILEDNR